MARVAICIAAEYEDSELDVPRQRLREAGHDVVIVGVHAGRRVRGKRARSSITVDKAARDVSARDFDALVIPGGHSPDHLRLDTDMVDFVRTFAESNKVVAAVCHGPQLLIEADVVHDRAMTSWPSVRRDLINAGARWVDQDVVEDGPFITSRMPEDLEAFSEAILRQLGPAQRASLAS
jgi:protease I